MLENKSMEFHRIKGNSNTDQGFLFTEVGRYGIIDNWRAGASQPSRTTGTIFLYFFLIFGRTGTADIRCLRTHYIHAVYIYVT